jgi:hypothetical protein
MVAFFMASGCPTQHGWTAALNAQGRLLVGVSDPSTVGVQVGNAMANQQSPLHYHSYNASVNLSSKNISGSSWPSWMNNYQGAASGSVSAGGDTANVDGTQNIPFIQLVVCQKAQQASSSAATTSGDTYPQATLAYFNLSACPSGWGPALDAGNKPVSGYYLVPFLSPAPGMLGTTVGTALASGEDRQHTHSFSSSISLSDVSYALVSGGGNSGLTSSGSKSFSGTTGSQSSAVPYVQLLLCQKTAFQHNTNPPAGVPGNVVTFFITANCPYGWKQTQITSGRFPVGLPSGGTPQVAFGGPPLSPGEDRTHTHSFSGSVSTSSYGVVGVSGGQADGYGGNGSYGYSGTTGAASAGLPYMLVTQCQPCSVGDDDPQCQATRADGTASHVGRAPGNVRPTYRV